MSSKELTGLEGLDRYQLINQIIALEGENDGLRIVLEGKERLVEDLELALQHGLTKEEYTYHKNFRLMRNDEK